MLFEGEWQHNSSFEGYALKQWSKWFSLIHSFSLLRPNSEVPHLLFAFFMFLQASEKCQCVWVVSLVEFHDDDVGYILLPGLHEFMFISKFVLQTYAN